ncbi:SIMPL domain-containing protein [Microcoleus sp. FACHB-1515]|uniref:SIMPL domain-containing protein n=1 Tax=Cyanophyceae TaxID=3028117 RepID=UPI001687F7BA|nr:SIMPL domain-containing protein [Microcoleus sp. FACHB-1515]MBD2091389.1 SIMPL domain-containing protein [Microcoleus sp. FACHB-1515]
MMSLSALAATALVAIAWTAPAKAMNPTPAAPARSIDETAIAQVPSASPNQPSLSVVGQGQADGVADTAEVQLTFVNYSYTALLERFSIAQLGAVGNSDSSTNEGLTSYLNELEPITQASLQPIVARLVAAGAPASAIEVNIDESASTGAPPFPEISSAQISVRLNRPSLAQIEAIRTAAASAIEGNDKLFLENNLVTYTSADCRALEQAAYAAAIADARQRAERVAAAANVTIEGVPSIAINNFDPLSYDLENSCDAQPSDSSGEAGAVTVQLQRSLTVTYPIR